MKTNKKIYTEDEMLDELIGKMGTPRRDEFEAKIKKEVDNYYIGEAIKQARKNKGMTQDELGELMGVKKSFVSKIESGKGVAYSTIIRAFKALGAETATLDLGKLGRVALW
ncbi:MAG: helix-turn-helix transcriptional regulator [Bacteroidales bacterium]|jgi:ribosome-binding protein aMBF1 (putative translation factor)|nr:helix-turn-helix transcriptional regulator [Bacteroidales bacterium]MBR0305076.1 helix-turn-helix transcriptional regulator [Bacteroidales bacterium]